MPWSIEDVEGHNHGLTPKQKRQWVAVANSVLEQTGDEGAAIERANGVVRKPGSLREAVALDLDSRIGDRHGVALREADDESHFHGAWRGGSKASGGGPASQKGKGTEAERKREMAQRVGPENVGKTPAQMMDDGGSTPYKAANLSGDRGVVARGWTKDERAVFDRLNRKQQEAALRSGSSPYAYEKQAGPRRQDMVGHSMSEPKPSAAARVEAGRLRDKAGNPFDGETAKQFEDRTVLKVQPRAKGASQEYLTRWGPESLSARPQDLHPKFRQMSPAELAAAKAVRDGTATPAQRSLDAASRRAAGEPAFKGPARPAATSPGSHADYKTALADAQQRADQSGLPVVIRKGKEVGGKPVFNVNYKSNDGSDHLGETVMPRAAAKAPKGKTGNYGPAYWGTRQRVREAVSQDLDTRLGDRMGVAPTPDPKALREADDDSHFYGAWKGGSKASGGRPMSKSEAAKPNKGEKPEDDAAANRAKGYPEYWTKADRDHHETVVKPRQERLAAERESARKEFEGKTSEERDKADREISDKKSGLRHRYGNDSSKWPQPVQDRLSMMEARQNGIMAAQRAADQRDREGRFARGEETAGIVTIRPHTYRGEEGYTVSARNGGRTNDAMRTFGGSRQSMFVKAKTRKGAEYVRDLIKKGKEVTLEDFRRAEEM